MSVVNGSVGGGGQSRVVMVFSWIAHFTGGGSRVSLSSCDPALGLPSAVLCSGAEVGNEEAPGGIVASIERRDSVISSSTGSEEPGDRISGASGCMRWSAMFWRECSLVG